MVTPQLIKTLFRQAVDEAPNPYDATPPAMGKIIERFNQLLTANGIDPQTGETGKDYRNEPQ